MPWTTPSLREVRSLVRDHVRGTLPGADASVPNSELRVLSDGQGALCHLTLQYVDWLADQMLPDSSETVWLDRHGRIWLVNADGTIGRKIATLAQGQVAFTATVDRSLIPRATQLTSSIGIVYETLSDIRVSLTGPVIGDVRALDPGSLGNLEEGSALAIVNPLPGVSQGATVVALSGGTDDETDDQLRTRVLIRIQQPPMGGAKHDYEQWALAVPAVTRAWASPLEMGMGTVTIRFLMDDLRGNNDGWPNQNDIRTVQAYLDSKRPVAVKDFFIVAPIKQPIDFFISGLVPDTEEVRAQIETSVRELLFRVAAPAQTIFASWKSYAVMNAPNVESFKLVNNDDDVMRSPGHMAVLGSIHYVFAPT
jgi:uncharacterized phage protein gp47/JayE